MTDETDRPSIRREVAESYDRYVDRVGRVHLHKISPMRFLWHLPPEAMTVIPGEFWSTDVNAEGYTEAVIACPCHETPRVEAGRLAECTCGRIFYFIGSDVMVGYVADPPRNQETPAAP